MSKEWFSRHSIFLFLAAVAATCMLVIGFWDSVVVWINANDKLAAWVQAVGSILAIGLALILWRGDRAREKRATDARARVVVFRLMPALGDIEATATAALKALVHIQKSVGSVSTETILLGARKALMFPPVLDSSVYAEFEYLDPEVAFRISHLFYTVDRHNRQLESLLALVEMSPDKTLNDFLTKQKFTFETVQKDLADLKPRFGKSATSVASFLKPADSGKIAGLSDGNSGKDQ